jgi:sugar phosphate isomerase/epimerase
LKADRLAEKLGAYLVFHSQYLHHIHIPDLEDLPIKSPHGFENNPGISIHQLEKTVLDRTNELGQDTAHLYVATENFQNYLDKLLKHAENIEVIHLCDSTSMKDGLAFGKGSIDMRETVRKIKDSDFNGKVVLEVMPKDQEEALEKWKDFTGQDLRQPLLLLTLYKI